MSNLLKSSGAVLLVVWSSACGSDVNVGAGGSGGGGGGGEGGQDPACVPFNDEESAGPVTFRVVNQSGADLYLQGACDSLSYSVDPITGPDGSFYGNVGGACQQSCEQLQHEDPLLCAADACAPSSILVASGTSRDFTWGGQGQRSTEMPASCFFSPEFGTSCQQIIAAEAGSYRLNLRAFSECGAECSCDENGVCFGEATGQEAFPNATMFDFPEQGIVEILYDVCAFPCPG